MNTNLNKKIYENILETEKLLQNTNELDVIE